MGFRLRALGLRLIVHIAYRVLGVGADCIRRSRFNWVFEKLHLRSHVAERLLMLRNQIQS